MLNGCRVTWGPTRLSAVVVDAIAHGAAVQAAREEGGKSDPARSEPAVPLQHGEGVQAAPVERRGIVLIARTERARNVLAQRRREAIERDTPTGTPNE
jgi:hypothetical protein